MRPPVLVLSSSLLLAACAGVIATREQAPESDQDRSEAGQLPVGRIASAERVDFDRGRELSPFGVGGRSDIPPVLELVNRARNIDWSYRYVVEMKGGGTRVVESQFQYRPGECLAFRSGLSPESVSGVRALPGECD